MTDLELYKEIGYWVYVFHNRKYFYQRLLKDFQHDCYLRLQGKPTLNREYVKIVCKYLPWEKMKHLYRKREYVLINSEGEPITEFPDSSYVPDFEFTFKKRIRTHKDCKKVKVWYKNGEEKIFDSITLLSENLGLLNYRSLYKHIGKPLSNRFTKRKMSHIRLIDYI